jgi:tRNA (guanosine-2'-O-)-methyltransferase
LTVFQRIAESCTSAARLARIETVLAERTAFLVPLFENLYKGQNASAVLRSCDALGIGGAVFFGGGERTPIHRDVTQGSDQWISIEDYPEREACFSAMRARGYRLVATCPAGAGCHTVDTLPLDAPVAVLFGNEKNGLEPATIAACDWRLTIPMHGFVDSFNISVSAALILAALRRRLEDGADRSWLLGETEKKRLRRRWLFHNTRVGTIVRTARRAGRPLADLAVPPGADRPER